MKQITSHSAEAARRSKRAYLRKYMKAHQRKITMEMVLSARRRFWGLVVLPEAVGTDVCWNWSGRVDKDGYGLVSIAYCDRASHRVAWMLAHGKEIPQSLHVLHHCDNPKCCNPDHLCLGTPKDNARDRDAKGRDRWSNP